MTTLQKIREEIEQVATNYDNFEEYMRVRGLWIALKIIDKYAEQEPCEKTSYWDKKENYVECNRCGCLAPTVEFATEISWKMSRYCPDCGARMTNGGTYMREVIE